MPAVLQSNLQWLKSNARIRLGNPYVYGGMYSPTVIAQGCDCSGSSGWALQALTLGPRNMSLDANGNWIHTVSTESWAPGAPPGTVGPFGTIAIASLSDIPRDAVATINIHHGGGGESSHMNLVLADGTIIESNGGPTTYTGAGQDGTGSCTNGTGGMASSDPYWTDHHYLPGPLLGADALPTQFYFDVSNNNWGGKIYTDAGKQRLLAFLAAARSTFHVTGGLHKVSQGSGFVDPYWAIYKSWCEDQTHPMSWLGYHYVDTSDPAAQAANFVGADGGSWAMLDFEQGSGTIDNFWNVVNAFNAAGVSVSLAYLPKWYWSQIGQPDLSSLASNQISLVASNYTATGSLSPGASYGSAGGNNGPGWAAYGGALPTCWQYTNAAVIGGVSVDGNAYDGPGPNLDALFTGAIFT
jgi:hypothetical protein